MTGGRAQAKITACVDFAYLCAANVDAVALDATCTPADGTKADCTDNNAICPAGIAKCQCKPGYKAHNAACGKCILLSEMVETGLFQPAFN